MQLCNDTVHTYLFATTGAEQILLPNPQRRSFFVQNKSTGTMYISACDDYTHCSTSEYNWTCAPGAILEIDDYCGSVYATWDGAADNGVYVTEFLAS